VKFGASVSKILNIVVILFSANNSNIHGMRLFLMIMFTLIFVGCESADTRGLSSVTGAERTSSYLPLLKGKSVGLTANHTSVIGKNHLADSLISAGIHITKIFSPEHGFRGQAGAGDLIGNSIDRQTGLPVISLYGNRHKPSKDDLEGIDIMVYDIQDVGVRFYTYISTMHYVMEACAEKGIPVIILDRPDPLGYYVDGPVLDTSFRSFVGMHPIPVVYGMTAGELAGMINDQGWLAGKIKCNLTVIPCENYDHNTRYDLPVNPSPNLNCMEAIYLYPSVCFFEGTVMSLGRGTDYPFRVVGHPEFPDTSFSFTPKVNAANSNPVFLNKPCYGVNLRNLTITELRQMKQINLSWLTDVYKKMGSINFFTDYIDKLAGTDKLRLQVTKGLTEQQIRQSWQDDLNRFSTLRKKYLLYADFK
jgi:uncharacterized protein YbbC (DUF1343 family)